jgi:hypothetical protein
MMTYTPPRRACATRRFLHPRLSWLVAAVFCCLALAGPAMVPSARAYPPPATLPKADATPGQASTAWMAQAVEQRHQHLAQLGVERWQTAGYRGRGVKVAILDTGFRGYHNFLGRALPAHVTVHSFRTDGNLEAKDSQHGILCGEVIHALAPDAELLFANWDLPRPDEYLAAVRWAREQGARIISCSVVTPNWSDGEGGGAIHQELTRLLGSDDKPGSMLCFASAGNTVERHWGGLFHAGSDGFHEWRPGEKDNEISPWGTDQVSVELYERPGTDYDVYVYDGPTGREVGHAHTSHNQGDRSSAVVRFQPEADHSYRVRVRLVHGPAGTFHLTTMEASLGSTVARASVCFPADGPEVVAMGAVDDAGHRLWYSACGPNSSRPKPDFVAVIPFPSLWRERPFCGTSAAAPQGAGLAALWWARHPDWTAAHVRSAMRAAARDLGPPGPDWETGYGLIGLPRP